MTRMLGGALFFQAFQAFQALQRTRARGAREPRIDGRMHVRLALLSLLGISLNQALFLLGLRWASPFAVSLLGATIPVLTAALAVLFRKERFVTRTALGLICALAGVLSLTGVGSLSTQDAKGTALVALNSLSYAAYVVLSRDVVLRVGPLRLMAWIFTYGALSFLPLGLAPMLAQLPHLSVRAWLLLLYILAMPTIVAYLLNAWALARSTPTLVTVYIYLQPLFAAVLARVQLGHSISPRAGIAAVLILGGLGVVASRRSART